MDQFEETVRRFTIPVMIAVMAGLARFAFSRERSVWSFIRGVTVSGFVGLMLALGLQSISLDEGVKGMIIGVSSFCADEVAQAVLAFAKEAQKDPFGYFSRVIDALRGKSEPK